MNRLYYGDNLTIMQRMPLASVDLIYLDPPFNSNKNYNLMYRTMTGKPVSEQVDAFCDTWEMDPEKEELARRMPILMREHGIEDYYVEFWRLWIQALRNTQPHLLAYLVYMVQRLMYMKTILKPTGSIYLHCDPTASHYIKVMMDGVFGHNNFRSEIVWRRINPTGRGPKRLANNADYILYYVKGDKFTWHKQYKPHDPTYVKKFYRHKDPKTGRLYMLGDLKGAGTRTGPSGQPWRGIDPAETGSHWAVPNRSLPHGSKSWSTQKKLDTLDNLGRIYWPPSGGIPRYKRYLDEMAGTKIDTIWDDIPNIQAHAKERMGYPTQKPVALLKRILQQSSNPGDVVFDPFCGCGTTIYAAHETGRQWIGCDIAILAVRMIREMLAERYQRVEGEHFEVDGIPVSVEQAQELFNKNPFQFEHWIVERVGAFPTKKTADRGIDGRLYFETHEGLKAMVMSVKGGGTVRPTDVRDLRGVLEREPDTEMAGFLSLKEPSKAMLSEASTAGQYVYNDVAYDRIQFLTAKDILEDGRMFETPTRLGSKIATGQASLKL